MCTPVVCTNFKRLNKSPKPTRKQVSLLHWSNYQLTLSKSLRVHGLRAVMVALYHGLVFNEYAN